MEEEEKPRKSVKAMSSHPSEEDINSVYSKKAQRNIENSKKSNKTSRKQCSKASNFSQPSLQNSRISAYKKYMLFTGKIRLKRIEFGSEKSGKLRFDVEYENNLIPGRDNHTIKCFSANIKENFEVPFETVYDKRKRQFYTESIKINVMNIHRKYNKKIGIVDLSLTDLLNKQLVY